MINIIKNTKKSSKEKHMKDIKIFLKKKRQKLKKDSRKTSKFNQRRKRKKASVLS